MPVETGTADLQPWQRELSTANLMRADRLAHEQFGRPLRNLEPQQQTNLLREAKAMRKRYLEQ